MRTAILLVLVSLFGGTLVSIGQALLVPDLRLTAREKWISKYRDDRPGAVKTMTAAIQKCGGKNNSNSNIAGAAEFRAVAAKHAVEILFLDAEGLDQSEIKKRVDVLIREQLTAITKKLNLFEIKAFQAYMKAFNEAKIMPCAMAKLA